MLIGKKTVHTDVTANRILCTELSEIMHHIMHSFVRNWIRYGQIQSQRSHTAFKSLNTAVNHHQPPSLHVLSRTSISSQSTLHNPLIMIHWEILHPMPDSMPHTCLHLRCLPHPASTVLLIEVPLLVEGTKHPFMVIAKLLWQLYSMFYLLKCTYF